MIRVSGALASMMPGTYVRANAAAGAPPKKKMLTVYPMADPMAVAQKLTLRENRTAMAM